VGRQGELEAVDLVPSPVDHHPQRVHAAFAGGRVVVYTPVGALGAVVATVEAAAVRGQADDAAAESSVLVTSSAAFSATVYVLSCLRSSSARNSCAEVCAAPAARAWRRRVSVSASSSLMSSDWNFPPL
jgi:hypothetical protein